MSSLMLFAIVMLSVCYGFNYNGSVRVKVNHDWLPDYEIPNWVYRDVFKHNKMTSMESSKLKETKIQYEQNIQYINEYDATYNMLIKLQMPLAFIQPINNII